MDSYRKQTIEELAEFYSGGSIREIPWRGTTKGRGPELGGSIDAMARRVLAAGRVLGLGVEHAPAIVNSPTYAFHARENPMESLIQNSEQFRAE